MPGRLRTRASRQLADAMLDDLLADGPAPVTTLLAHYGYRDLADPDLSPLAFAIARMAVGRLFRDHGVRLDIDGRLVAPQQWRRPASALAPPEIVVKVVVNGHGNGTQAP